MVLIALYRIKEGLMNFTQIRAHLIHQRQSSSSSMDPHCLLVSDIRNTLYKNRDIVFLFKMWISKIHKKNFILKITIWKQIPWQASTLSARSLAHSLVAPILTEFLVICKIEWLLGYVYQILFKTCVCEKIIKFLNWQVYQKKLKTYYFWTLPIWICTPPRWSQWPAPGRKVQFSLQQWVLVIFFWSLVKPPPAKCLMLVHWT